MGEYANYNGDKIKIGTCEAMYYLRYEDRLKMQPLGGNIDASKEMNLFWRLPFPDEDNISPGDYQNHNRGIKLLDDKGQFFSDPEIDTVGIMQLRHESGLLLNVPCYHGEKLPEIKDGQAFWNGKTYSYELIHIKNTETEIRAVIHCRHCNMMWSYTIKEILPYIQDKELKARIEMYAI